METRITAGFQYYLVRYSAVFIAYGVMWALDNTRFPIYVFLILSFFPMKEVSWANAERKRGYDFDTITLREQAEFINMVADTAETILAREIQIKRWLRPDLNVQSIEGLVNTPQKPSFYVQTDRDSTENLDGITWNIGLNGFIDWVRVVRM